MDLKELSRINYERCREWHTDPDEWSVNDWAAAMAGEVGEIGLAVDDFLLALLAEANRTAAHYGRALDLCKKLRRMTSNVDSNNNPPSIEDAIEAIGKEVADGFLYSDLLMHRLRLDTETVIMSKFNEISDRENLPQRMTNANTGESKKSESAVLRKEFMDFLDMARRFRETPIVDDDFPEMRHKHDGMLDRLLKKYPR